VAHVVAAIPSGWSAPAICCSQLLPDRVRHVCAIDLEVSVAQDHPSYRMVAAIVPLPVPY
jgi:hypothetical protein